MIKVGYARVSTEDQNLELQIDALKDTGCTKIFEEKMSGSKFDRPILKEAINYLRENDTLVVWKLDRLGRSTKDLIDIINTLNQRNINFKSIKENIDTSSPTGKLIFHIFASIAEFEKDLIKERTIAGLKAARARGKLGGRPKKLSKEDVIILKQTYENKDIPISAILKRFNINKTTLYKYLKTN